MNGAPAKPIRGVDGRRAERIERTASNHVVRAARRRAVGRTRSTSAAVADRVVDDRPFPLGELQVEAQRLEDQEDVGEQDRRVDPQPLGGRDGDLGRQLGVLAEFQERDLRTGPRGIRACTGPPAASARSGVTSVGSRRQAFRKGLSRRASVGGDRRLAIQGLGLGSGDRVGASATPSYDRGSGFG